MPKETVRAKERESAENVSEKETEGGREKNALMIFRECVGRGAGGEGRRARGEACEGRKAAWSGESGGQVQPTRPF